MASSINRSDGLQAPSTSDDALRSLELLESAWGTSEGISLQRPPTDIDRRNARASRSEAFSENSDPLPQVSNRPESTGQAAMVPVAALLFCSGACSLIYQVAWLREFRLVFGGTTAAASVVLAVFMGGLALGSARLGRRADRHGNPLTLYAKLELLIALASALTPFLITLCRASYIALGGQSALGLAGATVVRVLLAALVIGLPTFLMGGTLPAAVCAVEMPGDTSRRRAGLLYGVNALGAVFGTLLSTFWLLEHLGTRNTLWIACLVNLCVSLSALLIAWPDSRRITTSTSTKQRFGEGGEVSDKTAPARGMVPAGLVYAAAAIYGFAFLLMELVWYRMLVPILGGTTFTFGLILAVALAGIGLGGVTYAVVFERRRPTPSALALICALEAACLAFPFALGDRLAILAWILRDLSMYGFHGEVVGWSAVAMIVVFPAAMISGVQFPVLIALLGQGDDRVGRQIGLASAWNTGGAILGSFAGGFGLLPLLSAPGTWRAVVMLLCLVGISAVGWSWRRDPKRLVQSWALLICGIALAAILATGPTALWRHGGIGAGRMQRVQLSPNALQNLAQERQRTTIWEADGMESAVGIRYGDGYTFYVNGKADGNAVNDAGTQIMLGLLGAILHEEAKTGLVIGLGSGESAGWLADVPSIERVDVVEIEAVVDEMARRCAAVNRDALHHAKVRRIYNDAREMLQTTSAEYDLIASEPSNPYRAGVATLFTQEFYRAVQSRLRPHGLFTQWLQAYEIDGQAGRTILATLRSVFPCVEIWITPCNDLLLVCSIEPVAYPTPELCRKVEQEPIRSALAAAWHARGLEGFLGYRLAGQKVVDHVLLRGAELCNTDDRTVLEYGFARTVGAPSEPLWLSLMTISSMLGGDPPPLSGGTVDWRAVEAQRSAVILTKGGADTATVPLDETRRKRAAGLLCYLRGDMRGAVAHYESNANWPFSLIELSCFADAYANLGDPKALELLSLVHELCPAEADAIAAVLHVNRGELPQAVESLESTFNALRISPWITERYASRALFTAMTVANQDPTLAPRLLANLREPFVVYRCDHVRMTVALNIARLVGPAPLTEMLKQLEPHVPWEESVLRARLEAYTLTKDPLEAQARKDLDAFRSREVQGLISNAR